MNLNTDRRQHTRTRCLHTGALHCGAQDWSTVLLNYSVGGLYVSVPREFVASSESGSRGGVVLVSFAHPHTGLPLSVAARVVRVEQAVDEANVLRVGLRFEQPVLSLTPDLSSDTDASDPPSIADHSSSLSESLDFVLEDGLCGGARVVSISSSAVRLNSGFLPASGTKIKLQLKLDGVPFEVAGKVADHAGDGDPSDISFGVELSVEEESTRTLYLTLLERAADAVTAEMPAIRVDSA